MVWVQNIVAPTHDLSILDSVAEAAKTHLDIIESVMSACAPAHQWRLVMAPAAKINRPTDTIELIRWVAVQMLPLAHVDASDLVALSLAFPWRHPDVSALAGLDVELLTLIEANALRVCFDKHKLITRCRNTGPLDGAILQLLAIR